MIAVAVAVDLPSCHLEVVVVVLRAVVVVVVAALSLAVHW